MSLLVVGSVAYDTVSTPYGRRDNALGGSATYFSIAASYFTPVSVVAVVGEDFAPSDVDLLESKGVDTSGLERAPGQTFRWVGEYSQDLNSRETLDTQLNVFADFSPTLESGHRGLAVPVPRQHRSGAPARRTTPDGAAPQIRGPGHHEFLD